MAFGDTYATLAEFKTYLKWQGATDDAMLTDVLTAASREIEQHCHRQFNRDTATVPTATARQYPPETIWEVEVDDFYTTTGLLVDIDTSNNGSFIARLDPTQYELHPVNGILDGVEGWPYTHIRSFQGIWFPIPRAWRRTNSVRVSALWGWASVPAPVKRACLMLAAQTLKMQEAPLGVAGMDQFGTIRVRDLPQVRTKLVPYVRNLVLVG